jgi:hypothetical protein
MHRTARSILILMAAATLAAGAEPATAPPDKMSLDGVINQDSDDTLAFTPDGHAVFFDRSEGPRKTIMISRRQHGRWAPAEVAPFSGHWFDQDPVVAPDGRYMLFNSDRPTPQSAAPLVQTYFSKTGAPGSNIWRVDRKGAGWGEPRWLGPNINNDVFVDFAAIAGDDTLYFMRFDAKDRVMQLWRAAYRGGAYGAAQRVALGDPMVSIHDPAIAKDQSFIVFDYGKVKGGLGRLSIAYRRGNGWTAPIDLGDAANADLPWGAHLSLDERSVYVTGQSGIWRLPLDPWLKRRHGD